VLIPFNINSSVNKRKTTLKLAVKVQQKNLFLTAIRKQNQL